MVNARQVSLARMHSGQSGRIIRIDGGHGLVNRLAALGFRPGKIVTKISSMFMRGPVTVEIDRVRMAIGFGMAKKIIVELEETTR